MLDRPPFEAGRIYYRRQGILSQNTDLDHSLADSFMQASRFTKDILIVDSSKRLEAAGPVNLGEVAALRAANPFDFLRSVRFKQNPAYEVVDNTRGNIVANPDTGVGIIEEGGAGYYTINILDREIDRRIRDAGYASQKDYAGQFLKSIDQSVKSALTDILFRDKLSVAKHINAYSMYSGSMSVMLLFNNPFNDPPEEFLLQFAMNYLFLNFITSSINYIQGLPPRYDRSIFGSIFYPLLPVEQYINGRLFLAGKQEFVVPK